MPTPAHRHPNRVFPATFLVLAVAALLSLGATGCGQANDAPGSLISAEVVTSDVDISAITAEVDAAIVRTQAAQAIATTPEEISQLASDCAWLVYLRDVFLTWLRTTMAGRLHWTDHVRLKYWSTDSHGTKVRLSGAVFVPYRAKWNPVSVPILSVQHGTQIYRPYAPSLLTYDMKRLLQKDNVLAQMESILGYLMSMSGYVVVMPDYPSLGVSTDPHPNTHISIANSVEDMLKAAKKELEDEWGDYAHWDGRVFMMGYSEGGYATLVTARQLQAKGSIFQPVAVAPLDGPHDLSTTMRTLMIADRPHSSAYFLPYMLYGTKFLFGDATYGFSKTMKSPYDTSLLPLLGGMAKGGDVVAAMPRREGQAFPVPADILTPAFAELVSRPYTGTESVDGPVVTMLAANDSYRGWTPSMALKFIHCSIDDLVPRANSDAAYGAFQRAGATKLEPTGDVDPLEIPQASVHVSAALPAYLAGFQWIDKHYAP
jgi:pimeloyl-ACP methyl ester carboxylesterase